jgi:hypothetical protein
LSAIKTITILALLLGYLPALNAREGTEKRTEFGTGLEVGFALAEYHDTCIMFRVFFVSGEFFGGLHRNKPPDESTFKKGARTFRTFPDQLLVNVEATAYSCSGARGRPLPLGFGEGLLSDPAFEIAWKAGGEVRPTAVLPKQIRHKDYSLRWDYFLEIPARDIPLTEEFIVDVSMRGGNRCQISARLK